MNEVQKAIRARRSTRAPFDPERPVSRQDLRKILDAARWTPTPHNMQNFEILVVDDAGVLAEIGAIEAKVTRAFLEENYRQLSFSEKALRAKGTGLLAAWFPKSWTDPKKLAQAARQARPQAVGRTLDGGPLLLVVAYDPRLRAPDSAGDFLGILGLGCLLENMWLAAHALGISLHVMSEFGEPPVEEQAKRILGVPAHMRLAYACRLGYPKHRPGKPLRVRRALDAFTHHNRFGEHGLHAAARRKKS